MLNNHTEKEENHLVYVSFKPNTSMGATFLFKIRQIFLINETFKARDSKAE